MARNTKGALLLFGSSGIDFSMESFRLCRTRGPTRHLLGRDRPHERCRLPKPINNRGLFAVSSISPDWLSALRLRCQEVCGIICQRTVTIQTGAAEKTGNNPRDIAFKQV